MRYLLLIFILIFAMSIAASATAQMYEYRDAEGNIRFTDDLGNVPEDRRENVKRIREVPSTPAPSEWQDAPAEVDVSGVDATNGEEEVGIDLFEMGEALRSEQADLQEEYDSIEADKALLGDPPAEDAPLEEFDAYGAKVDEINDRIRDYQERLQDHEKRVKEYNARFEQ